LVSENQCASADSSTPLARAFVSAAVLRVRRLSVAYATSLYATAVPRFMLH